MHACAVFVGGFTGPAKVIEIRIILGWIRLPKFLFAMPCRHRCGVVYEIIWGGWKFLKIIAVSMIDLCSRGHP